MSFRVFERNKIETQAKIQKYAIKGNNFSKKFHKIIMIFSMNHFDNDPVLFTVF